MIYIILIMTAAGFCSGSIMYSYFLPKWIRGVDVRKADTDKNPGSTNAIRAAGKGIGFVCMALDVLKAFVPVFISVLIFHIAGFGLVLVAIAPVLGHAFSPFLGFRGGKALSTLFGTLLGLLPVSWVVFLVAICMFIFRFLLIIRPDSFGVVISLIASSIVVLFFVHDPIIKLILISLSMVVIVKHLLRPGSQPVRVSIGHFTIYDRSKKIQQ